MQSDEWPANEPARSRRAVRSCARATVFRLLILCTILARSQHVRAFRRFRRPSSVCLRTYVRTYRPSAGRAGSVVCSVVRLVPSVDDRSIVSDANVRACHACVTKRMTEHRYVRMCIDASMRALVFVCPSVRRLRFKRNSFSVSLPRCVSYVQSRLDRPTDVDASVPWWVARGQRRSANEY